MLLVVGLAKLRDDGAQGHEALVDVTCLLQSGASRASLARSLGASQIHDAQHALPHAVRLTVAPRATAGGLRVHGATGEFQAAHGVAARRLPVHECSGDVAVLLAGGDDAHGVVGVPQCLLGHVSDLWATLRVLVDAQVRLQCKKHGETAKGRSKYMRQAQRACDELSKTRTHLLRVQQIIHNLVVDLDVLHTQCVDTRRVLCDGIEHILQR